jgi:hypothetical protein
MRPLLIVLAAAIILGTAYHALPATDPTTEQPVIRLQKPKDASQAISVCTPVRTFIIARKLPDGTKQPVAVIFAPGNCEH